MGRPPRIQYPGACYHVMNRGNRGTELFRKPDDFGYFLLKLTEAAEKFRVSFRACCLMPTHFHFYLCTPDANLDRFMQSFVESYTVCRNLAEDSHGHIVQGRYRAILVEDETYGAQVGRYVHLNPVNAPAAQNLPRAERRRLLRTYAWSTYAAMIGLRKAPQWLDWPAAISSWGDNLDDRQENYARFVEEGLLKELGNPLDSATQDNILGTSEFVNEAKRISGGPVPSSEPGSARTDEDLLRSRATPEDIADAVARTYAINSAGLFQREYDGEPRRVLFHLCCRYCRCRLRMVQITSALRMDSTSSLYHADRAVGKKLSTDASLRDKLDRIRGHLLARYKGGS